MSHVYVHISSIITIGVSILEHEHTRMLGRCRPYHILHIKAIMLTCVVYSLVGCFKALPDHWGCFTSLPGSLYLMYAWKLSRAYTCLHTDVHTHSHTLQVDVILPSVYIAPAMFIAEMAELVCVV